MKNVLKGFFSVTPICITLLVVGITGWEYWLIAGVSSVTTFVFHHFVPRE